MIFSINFQSLLPKVSFVPGPFDEAGNQAPVGNNFYIKYKESDSSSDPWKVHIGYIFRIIMTKLIKKIMELYIKG